MLVPDSELVKFKNENGIAATPLDVEYLDGVLTRDSEVLLATTLEELIVSFPNNKINVEIKQEGDVGKCALEAVIGLLSEHDAFDRVVLASFHSSVYKTFTKLQKNGDVPDVFMYSPGTDAVVKYYVLYVLGLDVFSVTRYAFFSCLTKCTAYTLTPSAFSETRTSTTLPCTIGR